MKHLTVNKADSMDKSIYVVDRTDSNISINNPFNLQSWVDKDWAEIDERKTIWLKFNKKLPQCAGQTLYPISDAGDYIQKGYSFHFYEFDAGSKEMAQWVQDNIVALETPGYLMLQLPNGQWKGKYQFSQWYGLELNVNIKLVDAWTNWQAAFRGASCKKVTLHVNKMNPEANVSVMNELLMSGPTAEIVWDPESVGENKLVPKDAAFMMDGCNGDFTCPGVEFRLSNANGFLQGTSGVLPNCTVIQTLAHRAGDSAGMTYSYFMKWYGGKTLAMPIYLNGAFNNESFTSNTLTSAKFNISEILGESLDMSGLITLDNDSVKYLLSHMSHSNSGQTLYLASKYKTIIEGPDFADAVSKAKAANWTIAYK